MDQDLCLFPIRLSEIAQLLRNAVREEMASNYVPPDPTLVKYLNRQELAEKLNVSKRTIAIWTQKGKIPSIKVGSVDRYA